MLKCNFFSVFMKFIYDMYWDFKNECLKFWILYWNFIFKLKWEKIIVYFLMGLRWFGV